MRMATCPGEQCGPSQGQHSQAPSKIARVLAHLLYSTISSLTHNYGLRFMRPPEKVSNHWGASCDVTRYSLPSSAHRRAQNVPLPLNQRNTARPLRSELRA